MRHVSLTCKNHPKLRWSCKAIAFSPEMNGGLGGYNQMRNIFFKGIVSDPVEFYDDKSGVKCNSFDCVECDCDPSNLIRAPEDIQLEQFDKQI